MTFKERLKWAWLVFWMILRGKGGAVFYNCTLEGGKTIHLGNDGQAGPYIFLANRLTFLDGDEIHSHVTIKTGCSSAW